MAEDSKKTFAERAKGIAALPGEKLAELKAFGAEKVQETLGAFLLSLPALKKAGYDLREFEIELGLTPKVIAHFMPLQDLSSAYAPASAGWSAGLRPASGPPAPSPAAVVRLQPVVQDEAPMPASAHRGHGFCHF
jgi:hypothetical protein